MAATTLINNFHIGHVSDVLAMPARPTVSFRFDDYSTTLVTHGKSSGAFYFETSRARSPLHAYSRIQIVRT
ncbi:hypothetical protein F443_04123, partial [Phytophthora nicotianae P1569]